MTVAERTRPGWGGRGEYPTLGWAVLDHMAEHLPSPSDPLSPLVLTDEQARIVLDFYRLDEVTGDFVNRRGRLEMAKGWGKSPLVAAIAIEEFAGPVRFGGWGGDGEPIAVPVYWPVVEIAAVSEDQTDNTWSSVYEMLSANEGRAARELGIDVGRTRCYLTGGRPGTMRPVTAESSSREGARLTFAVLDETHLWFKSNGGVRLASVLRRNAAKMDGRTLETTNAPSVGLKSVAEESGEGAVPGVLHVCRRASELPQREWPPERIREELVRVYGDSWWAPIDRLAAEIADPATDWEDALRFYFNLRTSAGSRAFLPAVWADRAVGEPCEVPHGTLVTVGIDGSKRWDHFSMIATEVATGYQWPLGIWVPGGAASEVPMDVVDATLAQAFADYDVWRVYADPPYIESWVASWKARHGEDRVVSRETASVKLEAYRLRSWAEAQRTGEVTHCHPSHPLCALFSEHVANAVRRETGYRDDQGPLWTVEKERQGSPAKIDSVPAADLSWEARTHAIAAGAIASAAVMEPLVAWA